MKAIRVQGSFIENLKKFFRVLAPYKVKFGILLVILLVIESTILLERYLFKIIVDNGTLFAAGTLARPAFVEILLFIAILYPASFLVRAAGRWGSELLVQVMEVGMIADVKRKFFNHIVGLSLRFHTSHKTGSLISRLGRGTKAVESMMDTISFNFTSLIFQLLVATISLFYIDKLIAAVIFIVVILFVVYSIIIQQFQLDSRYVANEAEDIEKANIGDILTNIESVKYFAKEHVIGRKYHDLSERTKRAFLRNWSYYRALTFGQTIILATGTAAVIYIPIRSFLAGNITIGTLVFVYTVYVGFSSPLYSFVYGLRSFYQSVADFESLYQYEEIRNDIVDKPGAKELAIKKGSIAFRHVGFTYTNRKILDNFSLEIRPNEKVALVGPSGSGKSTVVKLLYHMYDIQEGEILVDGKNITDFTQDSLRSELSVVPQECVLFDDTIYNNILFSRPDATREEVLAAMHFAQLDKIITNFPQKEETIVGERGVKLSGGEKQRVSIARAILADKKVLVLDEATSSLDSETEHEIQQDLAKLMRGRTSIIIAHRLSTIMSADKIVVIENGKVTQLGTHKELIRQKGRYKKLWNLQKGGYIK